MSEALSESFSEMFEQSLANQRIRPGMILTGLVVDVGSDVVIVNVGLKSEAVIPLEQFKNERGEIEVAAGDQVEVALDSVEDGTGETRLSREKAKRARTWTRLEEAFNKAEIVSRRGRGGGDHFSSVKECWRRRTRCLETLTRWARGTADDKHGDVRESV